MKILFLTKRHYMSRDLLLDRYGRFYELPAALAAGGATVTVSCLSYYDDGDSNALRRRERGVDWRSTYVGRNPAAGLYRYYRLLCERVRELRPGIVVGASDSLHVILAAKLARKFHLPCGMDLYDNFESYGQMRVPGLKRAYRQSLRGAGAVATVSARLRDHVRDSARPRGRIEVIENAVPAGLFAPLDRTRARAALGLPAGARLVGTAGSLYGNRDTALLYRAFQRLAARHPDVYLVLAGSTDGRLPVPEHERILYLGDLPYALMPSLYSALDVGVICNRDDAFGRYCFPQKLYEMLACGLPVVAAGVGITADLFRDCPQCLYRPGDAGALERALLAQLAHARRPQLSVPDWGEQGCKLLRLLDAAVAAAGA